MEKINKVEKISLDKMECAICNKYNVDPYKFKPDYVYLICDECEKIVGDSTIVDILVDLNKTKDKKEFEQKLYGYYKQFGFELKNNGK